MEIFVTRHGQTSYFTKYPLENLRKNNEEIKTLKNCEVIKFNM